MDFKQTTEAQLAGRYSEVLRTSLQRQRAAVESQNLEEQFRWTIFIVKASRFIGRTNEAIVHANHAVALAKQLGTPAFRAEALHALAISFKGVRRFDDSLAMLAQAADLVPADTGELLKATLFIESAEIAIEVGKKEEALSTLARGSAMVNLLGEPRLLAWTLYLRSQLEDVSPADVQLSTAYEIARKSDIPELQWQILWQLSLRADEYGRRSMREDFVRRAIDVLTRMAALLQPDDVTFFWKEGARRRFIEDVKVRYGHEFLKRVQLEGPQQTGRTAGLMRDMGWDPSLIPKYIRTRIASQVQWP